MSPDVLRTLMSIRAERIERMNAMRGLSSSQPLPDPDVKAVPSTNSATTTATDRERLPKHMTAEERARIPEPWNEPEPGKLTQKQVRGCTQRPVV